MYNQMTFISEHASSHENRYVRVMASPKNSMAMMLKVENNIKKMNRKCSKSSIEVPKVLVSTASRSCLWVGYTMT